MSTRSRARGGNKGSWMFRGAYLRSLREAAWLSRARMRDLLQLYLGRKISEESMRKHEIGDIRPRWGLVRDYAELLGTTPELLTWR